MHEMVRLPVAIFLVQSVPDPQSVMITSSTGTLVLNGSNVTLTCSILLHQNILSELSLLMVNAQFTRPDGSVLDILDPVISDGATYNFTTQVNSFGDSDVGNYTCNTTVSTCPSLRDFLIGMGLLVSNPIKIVIG